MNNCQVFNIAIAFDQNYLAPVYALLTSLFLNNRNSICIHAIASGLTNEQLEELEVYSHKHNSIIHFYKIDDNFGADFVLPDTLWWTAAIYYRLLFPSLLPPDVSRFLYLDTDIIVLKSLHGLFEFDMQHKAVGAVSDKVHNRPELGISGIGNYFNSGVLLIDRSKWVSQNITEKTIDFIRNHSDKLVNPDQDALNAELINNWVRLPSSYNFMYEDIPAGLTRRECQNLAQNVVILHYTTQHKPWAMIGRNPLRYIYQYYLSKAPNKYRVRYTDFVWNRHRLREMAEIRLAELRISHRMVQFLWPAPKSES